MTSVLNLLQPSSGNKYYWLGLMICLFLASCTTQIIHRKTNNENSTSIKKEEKTKEKNEEKNDKSEDNISPKKGKNKDNNTVNIAMLLPFKASEINMATASTAQIQNLNMSIDFYQGFLMGIDSAVQSSLKVNIKVLDTKENESTLKKMLQNDDLRHQQLLIGPIFPKSLASLTAYTMAHQILMISPLAATSPAQFNNPELISMVPNIAVHAQKMVTEAALSLHNQSNAKLILINTPDEESALLAKELKKYFAQQLPNLKVWEYSSIEDFAKDIDKNNSYCIFVSTSARAKVNPILMGLHKLKSKNIDLQVYGHPSWLQSAYPSVLLSELNVHLSTASYADINKPDLKNFIKNFKAQHTLNPSDFAFKGFDLGYYIGLLLQKGADNMEGNITKTPYKGLISNYDFKYHAKYGYINVALKMAHYENKNLKVK